MQNNEKTAAELCTKLLGRTPTTMLPIVLEALTQARADAYSEGQAHAERDEYRRGYHDAMGRFEAESKHLRAQYEYLLGKLSDIASMQPPPPMIIEAPRGQDDDQ